MTQAMYHYWCYFTVKTKFADAVLGRGGENKDWLPFVPQVGMKLSFAADGDTETTEQAIVSVTWCVSGEVFWLELECDDHVPVDSECQCRSGDNCCTIVDAMDDWLKRGWTIHEGPYPSLDHLLDELEKDPDALKRVLE